MLLYALLVQGFLTMIIRPEKNIDILCGPLSFWPPTLISTLSINHLKAQRGPLNAIVEIDEEHMAHSNGVVKSQLL